MNNLREEWKPNESKSSLEQLWYSHTKFLILFSKSFASTYYDFSISIKKPEGRNYIWFMSFYRENCLFIGLSQKWDNVRQGGRGVQKPVKKGDRIYERSLSNMWWKMYIWQNLISWHPKVRRANVATQNLLPCLQGGFLNHTPRIDMYATSMRWPHTQE